MKFLVQMETVMVNTPLNKNQDCSTIESSAKNLAYDNRLTELGSVKIKATWQQFQ